MWQSALHDSNTAEGQAPFEVYIFIYIDTKMTKV